MPEVIKYQKASNDIRPTVAKIVRSPVEALDEREHCVFLSMKGILGTRQKVSYRPW